METYGLTLRKIRNSLNINQSNLSEGIMSQSNYSKVEKGDIDIPFTKMIELLERLGMTIDEFLYIHHDYKKIPGKQLKRLNTLKPGDKTKITENINKLKSIPNPNQRQEELLVIFEALNLISNDDYEAAGHKVAIIWERLKKHDNWYLYDMRLINSILYLFPIDTAGSIVNLVMKRLENYKYLGNIHQLSANMQINYLLLLIKNDEYNLALSTAERLIDFSINYQLYTHLAASYVRKGIILKNLNESDPSMWYDKGFELLKVTSNQNMIQELNKEVQLYTEK